MLENLLELLTMTENVYNGLNPDGSPVSSPSFMAKIQSIPMFCSDVTLVGLKVSIKVILDLVPYLFSLGFDFVLTGKLNQDAYEVQRLNSNSFFSYTSIMFRDLLLLINRGCSVLFAP